MCIVAGGGWFRWVGSSVPSGHGEGVFVMSSEIIAQVPEAYGTGIMPFQGLSSRAVARSTRREVDAVLGRAEVAHARDQARAVLASGALSNTAALVGLAEQCYTAAPAGAPYYEAIIKAYGLGAARAVAGF